MSQLVFPSSLAGMDIKVVPEPVDDTQTSESASAKEIRQTASTYQRKRWTLDFNILRTDSSMADTSRWRELQQLFTQWARSFGRLSDFLFTDPDDSSVVDMGFAVGDGATTGFQIQRSMAGDLIDAAGFEYRAQTKPYTNLLCNSSFETDSNADGLADVWNAYNNSTGTEPVTTRLVPGMNGGKAQRVSWGTNNTSQKGLQMSGGGTAGVQGGWVAGRWYTISFFARAFGSVVGTTMQNGLNWNAAPTTTLNISNPALSNNWQRYLFQVFWNVGASVETLGQLFFSINSAGAVFGDLDFDLVQVVAGQHGVGDFQPIETPAAATGTRTPAYWPAFGDGFEPIPDLNGDVTIYEDGTWRGRRTLYPYTRRNLVPFSEQFDNAAWVKTNVTITANSTTAPDGTVTGDTISEGAVATAQHHIYQVPSTQEVVGDLRCVSVFVKANNLPNIRWEMGGGSDEGINFNLSTGVIDSVSGSSIVASGVILDPRWPGWSRIWFVRRTASATTFGPLLRCCADGTYSLANYSGTSRTFFAWGAQAENVSNLSGPTPYIQTPSSTGVTVTDYTLSSTGVFTPVAVPAAGTFFSFDGAFYRRVRFDLDSMPASRLAQAMYEAKQIKIVSVK